MHFLIPISCREFRKSARNKALHRSSARVASRGGHMTSLSRDARITGLLYIVSSLFGLVRLIYIPNTLMVSGDASATANNIAGHEMLFRFGILSYLIGSTLWIFVTLGLYRLLKGVDQSLAVLMVIGGLMVVPI